jgi:hypothetical protein
MTGVTLHASEVESCPLVASLTPSFKMAAVQLCSSDQRDPGIRRKERLQRKASLNGFHRRATHSSGPITSQSILIS